MYSQLVQFITKKKTDRTNTLLAQYEKISNIGYSSNQYDILCQEEHASEIIEIILQHYKTLEELGFTKEQILSTPPLKNPTKVLSALVGLKKYSEEMDSQEESWILTAKKNAILRLSWLAWQPLNIETRASIEEALDTLNLLNRMTAFHQEKALASIEKNELSHVELKSIAFYCEWFQNLGFNTADCIAVAVKKDGLFLLKTIIDCYGILLFFGLSKTDILSIANLKHGQNLLKKLIEECEHFSKTPSLNPEFFLLALEKHYHKELHNHLKKIQINDENDVVNAMLEALNFIESLKEKRPQYQEKNNAENLAKTSSASKGMLNHSDAESIREIHLSPIKHGEENLLSATQMMENETLKQNIHENDDLSIELKAKTKASGGSNIQTVSEKTIKILKGHGFTNLELRKMQGIRDADHTLSFIAEHYQELRDTCNMNKVDIISFGFRRDKAPGLAGLLETYPSLRQFGLTHDQILSINHETAGLTLRTLKNEFERLIAKIKLTDLVEISKKRYSAASLMFLSLNIEIPARHIENIVKHLKTKRISIDHALQSLECESQTHPREILTVSIPKSGHADHWSIEKRIITLGNTAPSTTDDKITSAAHYKDISFFSSLNKMSGNKRSLETNENSIITSMQTLIDKAYTRRHLERIAEQPNGQAIFDFILKHQETLENLFPKDTISAMALHNFDLLRRESNQSVKGLSILADVVANQFEVRLQNHATMG